MYLFLLLVRAKQTRHNEYDVKHKIFFRRMAFLNLSESVFVGMCLKLGTPKHVTSRRDIVDIMQLLRYENIMLDQ